MRIRKKISAVICTLLIPAMLAGCWDSKELEDLAIPLVGAYDLILEEEKEYPDDKYLVTAGIPVFYENVQEKFHIIESTGRIVGESRGRRNTELGEVVIFGQLQMLIFGEELAREENLLELTDIISRNPAIKASLYLLVAKGRAVDLIRKPIYTYPNIGEYLKALLKNTKNSNFYPCTTLFSLNRDLISYETSAILPHVIYSDGEISLAGSCLANKGKVVAEFGREETETLVMLRGIKCRGAVSFEVMEDGKAVDEATFEGSNSRKVTVERLDDKYLFNIQIKLEGIITEHANQKPIGGSDLPELFQTSLEQNIKRRAEEFVEKTQKELKFDTLSLANYIKAYTREKLTKEDIDKIVSESDINIEVKAHIRSTGGKM
ncbi:MAG TPA: Ger(x)C family spore germination protein [Clostridia bacterium]|nr:Ger(x)C family spore germination protein [Clostridia bacterium]